MTLSPLQLLMLLVLPNDDDDDDDDGDDDDDDDWKVTLLNICCICVMEKLLITKLSHVVAKEFNFPFVLCNLWFEQNLDSSYDFFLQTNTKMSRVSVTCQSLTRRDVVMSCKKKKLIVHWNLKRFGACLSMQKQCIVRPCTTCTEEVDD